MKKLFLSLIAFILLLFNSNAQEVMLKGRVFERNNPLDGVSIVVFDGTGETELKVVEVSKSGKFKFTLEEETNYEIEIRKEGYLSKHISLCISAAGDAEDIPPFAFDVDMFRATKFKHVKVNMKSTPAAHIYYNTETSTLDWDRSVTTKAQDKMEELKQKNDSNRRAKYSNF